MTYDASGCDIAVHIYVYESLYHDYLKLKKKNIYIHGWMSFINMLLLLHKQEIKINTYSFEPMSILNDMWVYIDILCVYYITMCAV